MKGRIIQFEVSNGLDFDWDGMVLREDEFELVDDTMSQDEEECDDNPIEVSDTELDMELKVRMNLVSRLSMLRSSD